VCYLVDTPPAYGDTLDPRASVARIRRYVEDALEERADPAEALRRHVMGGGGGGDGDGDGGDVVEARGPPRGRGKPSGFDCRVDLALCLLPPRRPQALP
jgi:hypothetical protein